jgi:hypothetical protein
MIQVLFGQTLRQTMTTTIKELKDFISFRVDQITDGRQKPYFITSEDNFVLAQHPLPIAIDKGVQK